MRRLAALLFLAARSCALVAADKQAMREPRDSGFTTAPEHSWWEFPVRVVFRREDDADSVLAFEGCWSGRRQWLVWLALPKPGLLPARRMRSRPDFAIHGGRTFQSFEGAGFHPGPLDGFKNPSSAPPATARAQQHETATGAPPLATRTTSA